MKFIRSLGRASLGYLVSTLLLLTPIIFAVHSVIGSPEPAKQALRQSGTYDSAVSTAIDESIKNQQDPATKAVLAEPGVRESISKAFTPKLLQDNTERNIDIIYDWFSGKTDTLQLQIDVKEARPELVKALSEYATARLQKLPACTLAQTRTLNADQITKDPLSLQCLPQGLNVQEAANTFGETVANQVDVLNRSSDNITPSPASDTARSWFKLFTEYFWVPAAVAAALAGAYVLLHIDRRHGMKRLARIVLFNGIALGIITLILSIILNRTFEMLREPGQVNLLQSKLTDALAPLANNFKMTLLWWALGYLVVGIAALILLRNQRQVAPTEVTKL